MEISLNHHWHQYADTTQAPPPPAAETPSGCDLYSWGARLFEDWTYTLLISATVLAITGLVFAILAASLFFSVAFAILAMTTFYAAKEIKLLGDMITEVNRFRAANENLEAQVTTLTGQVQNLGSINAELTIKLDTFNQQNTLYKSNNEVLTSQIALQQKSSEALTDRLQALAGELSSGSEHGQQAISTMVDALRVENEKSKLLIQQTQHHYSENFSQLQRLLEDALNSKAPVDNLRQLILIQEQVRTSMVQLQGILSAIENNKGALGELEGQVSTMKTQVAQFSAENDRLAVTATKLHRLAGSSPSVGNANSQFSFASKEKLSSLKFNGTDSIV